LVCQINGLTLQAIYPEDKLPITFKNMYVRGDSCGLDWDNGQVMTYLGNNVFEAEVDCSSKNENDILEMKV